MQVAVALALMTFCLPVMAENLALRIVAPAKEVHLGDHSEFWVTISNRGPKSVTLVQPGDGSECKWRTPVVGWSVLPADAREQKHPETPPLFKGGRCGNINPIKLSEVFSLKPGESKRLEGWIGFPTFEKPGKYRLVFCYQNIPDLEISGLPLGPHEKGVVERMKRSTPCRLVSEEITVDVLPKSL